MWRFKVLMTALVVAFAGGIGAGSGTVAGQAGGPLANTDVGVAAIYQPPSETIEVFAVADDGAVVGVWKERNSIWRPPVKLTPPGFAQPGAPVAAVYQPRNNQVEVFVVDNEGVVWDIWKANNGPWQPPIKLTGPNFAPSGAHLAAVWYPNGEQLEVFVVDRNGAISVMWKASNGPWQPPAAITRPNIGREGSPLAAVYYPNGEQLEVFVVGNGAVQVVWKAKGLDWQPPGTISGPNFAPNGAPLAAVYYPNGEQLEVFVVGNNGVVRGLWKAEGRDWQANVTLTGPDFASPRTPVAAVYQPRNEQLEVFYAGKDGSVWDSWKAKGVNWQPPVKVTGPNFIREGTPLAAVAQALGDHLELFAVDGSGTVRGVHKAQNGPWREPFSLTRANFTPMVSPGDCTKFFRRWRDGFEDDWLMGNCTWIMGIEPYCRAHDAFSALAYDGNRRYLKCAPYSRPDDAIDQIEHIARGVVQGLETAFVASAPYLGLAVSGVACVNSVVFACAVLALDLAARAGLDLPPEAADAVRIAGHVLKCVDGNIVSCAQVGTEGATAAGITLPGMDAAKVVADAKQCAEGTFAACMRLGLMAADAAGVTPGFEASDIADLQNCLNGDNPACLALGQSAAEAAGFPLKDVLQGVDNARRCDDGDTNACIALGKGLVGSAVPQGAENAPRCAGGDTTACFELGKALAGNNLSRDVEVAIGCQHGNTDACVEIGKAIVARTG